MTAMIARNAQAASIARKGQGAMMMEQDDAVARRLRKARIEAGWTSAISFARAHGLNQTSYSHHENGRRRVRPDVAKMYAQILKLPAGTLLYGEQLHSVPRVRIVGRIGPEGKIDPVLSIEGLPQTVVLPDPSDMVAHVVCGDELYPAYRNGDIVLHRALDADNFDLASLHGHECVIEMADGRQLLRQISVQPDGRVTLFAYHAPPMFDQRIVAAAPIEFVQRRLPRVLPFAAAA